MKHKDHPKYVSLLDAALLCTYWLLIIIGVVLMICGVVQFFMYLQSVLDITLANTIILAILGVIAFCVIVFFVWLSMNDDSTHTPSIDRRKSVRKRAYSEEEMVNLKGFGQRQPDGSVIWYINGQKKASK